LQNSVRIIAGKYRGRKLNFLPSQGLRPSPDRVRETVFNWLMQPIKNSHCLDLFAGSGALGFEALSRGAANVVFVEKVKKVADMLKSQLQLFKAGNAQIVNGDALQFLQKNNQQFDILFLDPPFNCDLLTPCLKLLKETGVLHTDSLIYVESEKALELNQDWQWLKHQVASQVHYGLLQPLS